MERDGELLKPPRTYSDQSVRLVRPQLERSQPVRVESAGWFDTTILGSLCFIVQHVCADTHTHTHIQAHNSYQH